MGQPNFVKRLSIRPGTRRPPAERVAPSPTASDHVVAAASARSAEWSAAAAVDVGDSHEKGEASLCVGEAV